MQDPKKSSLQKPQIQFSSPVIVLGGGEFDPAQLREFVEAGYPLITADGAADAALALGLPVHAVIGDFDSVADKNAFPPDVKMIEIGEQETTDFEKCLYSVEAPAFICFGMLGKRVDHTLAAFHTVAKYGEQKNIVLMDQVDVSFGVSGTFSIELPVGTRFSVYPLSPIQFEHSDGLKYPLNDLTLEIGARVGTSNEVNATRTRIVPACDCPATYLLILPKARFSDVLKALLNES